MCTVTFLPKGDGKYILTSNRDETPKRAAAPPQVYQIHNQEITFPKDPLAGGTWIATDNKRFTLCLLNGAFEKHKHVPPYKTSRGIMLLDFFKFNDAETFQSSYDFEGIEPFTLVIVDAQKATKVFELRWNEKKVSFKEFPNDVPRIWSSSTLYPKAISDQRASWFQEWLTEHTEYNRSEIIDFHKNGGRGDLWNNFIMKRGDHQQTVSITAIEKSDEYEMVYEDLLT